MEATTPVCIQVLVLDEADEMLNKGFREQIYDIYRCVAGFGPTASARAAPYMACGNSAARSSLPG